MDEKTTDAGQEPSLEARREARREKRRKKAAAAKLKRQKARAELRETLRQREIPLGAADCPPVDLTRLVAFDTERSGFVEDDFIEIGAVRVDLDQGTIEDFHALMEPRSRLNRHVTALTGFTPEDLKGQEHQEDVLPRFVEFVGDAVAVGHAIGDNDLIQLNQALARYHLAPAGSFAPPFIDTEHFSHRLFDGPECPIKKFGLAAMLTHLGFPLEERHRALDDAAASYVLLRYLLDMIHHPEANRLRGVLEDRLR